MRREYEGATLREHYGLPRPVSRYAARPREPVPVGGPASGLREQGAVT